MKRKENGISMISLIVVIVSIIILATIAITAGYNYITESQNAEKAALVSLISEAAYRRQNDYNINVAGYYAGNLIKEESITTEDFRNLPGNFEEEKTKIHEELNGADPIWFILDGDSVKELGITDVDNYEKYIVKTLPSSNDDEYSPVAVVEYITGNTYLVEMRNGFASQLNPSDHEHVYLVATCFEPMKCKICGDTEGSPLPHLVYGKKLVNEKYVLVDDEAVLDSDITELIENHTYTSTCTQALMCKRCGTVFKEASGHSFSNEYSKDTTKHWYECLNGCGTRKDEEVHDKQYICVNNDPNYHKQNCHICGWESAETRHTIVIENKSATTHKIRCTVCDYGNDVNNEITHNDTGWQYDRTSHWKECTDGCGEQILKAGHKDEDGNYVCDVCGRYMDDTPPLPFENNAITVISKTTQQISVQAKTVDNEHGIGLAYYEFSIDNGTTWQRYDVANDTVPGQQTYSDLIHNHDYVILVRAVDKNDNVTQGSIRVNTYEVPAQEVESQVSTTNITSGTVTVTLSLPEISLPQLAIDQLRIQYKINDGNWQLYSSAISVTQDATTIIKARIVDTRPSGPNVSRIEKTITISNIDKTPPTVTIEATNSTQGSTSHTATIRIRDEKAGIAAGTTVQYAWSNSGTTAPSQWLSKTTGEAGKNVTVTVTSPSDVEGTYYLWVKSGVKDAVNNATTSNVVSSMIFEIDDVAPTLTTRVMENSDSNAIDKYYVKTGDTIKVSITSNKNLSQGPLVRIGTKEVRAIMKSNNRKTWEANIIVDNSQTEGLLNDVEYSDFISYSGKEGVSVSTNTDSKYVTYDKTLPVLNYVDKGGVTASYDENYVGCYADIDNDGTIDGVIYVDLLKQAGISGKWNNKKNAEYSIPTSVTTENVKNYIVSETTVIDSRFDNTPRRIVKPADSNVGSKDRFFIMSLNDFTTPEYIDPIDSNNNYPSYTIYRWYKNASGKMDPIITEDGFGTGKENTRKMIEKWNAAGTSNGYAGATQDNQDIWKHMQEKYNQGWFIPSRAEWSAFANTFNITNVSEDVNNYEKYGFNGQYCTSSQYNSGCPYSMSFIMGNMMKNLSVASGYYVRLSTTF